MKIAILAGVLGVSAAMVSPSGLTCVAHWDYNPTSSAWIDGFRFYQDGTMLSEVTDSAARSAPCNELVLNPRGGPITMTAFRGDDESPQSDPASYVFNAPGLRLRFDVVGAGDSTE